MKTISNKFKEEIKKYGRQIDTIITYIDEQGEHLLDSDVLFSVTPTLNGGILKSVMKQLDFESSIAVPKDTIIKVKFGVQIDLSLTVQEVNEMKVNRLNELLVKYLSSELKGFEYIDLGNYIVSKEPEYNADTLSYSHICYDKMLYSMKDYEILPITYPISVREYIDEICEYLGLTFKDKNNIFANYNKQIKLDLYEGYDYTFRDILDELAQVTASTICINESTDELEIRYLNETNEIIDEDSLKDVNVAISEKYGPINSIVLSRSAESDNVYLQDENSVEENGLCELKIIDNQIMNDNDRSDFLQDILNQLDGINYYINDFDSPGIAWLELCDKYTVKIGNNQYNCVLFNDEIKITQGLEETIYTEMPETSETDYSKSDKTDRKINKAYIIVDKQNQKIEALVSQIGDRSQKTTTVTQDIDGINQKVEDIEDVTEKVEGVKTITLENCVEGDLLELHIYGNNSVFDYLYPANNLYPSDDLYPYGDSRIVVTNEDNSSEIYELGVTEVLRQNSEVCDEYILKDGQAKVIKRVNKSGTTKAREQTINLGKFAIRLKGGTNTITIQNYTAKIKTKFAYKNDYTEIFATKVEMNSSITQTAEEINLEVRKKVDENEIISKINQSAEQISIEAEKISLSGKTLNLADNMAIVSNKFNVDSDGNMSCNNATMTGGKTIIYGGTQNNANLVVGENENYYSSNFTEILPAQIYADGRGGKNAGFYANGGDPTHGGRNAYLYATENGGTLIIGNTSVSNFCVISGPSGNMTIYGPIQANAYNYNSLEDIKKNIEPFEDKAIEIIKKSKLYRFNYKTEKEEKKHIGFIIGKEYQTPNEVLSNNGDSIDSYTMNSIMWKAIQELAKENEKLKQRIERLEEK